ncbi:MAG TPA: NAD(P)H-dependent oxidoreductase subunit E [Candidatus Limnocylindrales bacterium]|nr:NAD(P)H-dependent oxidoreductase subunit E [Candidatus Limnocylindrales bacterium]
MADNELTPLQSILAALAPQGRSGLLPALHAAQRIDGWISEPVATAVSRALGVPLADVCGVIDFYELFNRQPVGRTIVRVCSAPVCALAGAEAVIEALCRHLQTEPGDMSSDGAFTVEHAPCLGLCDHAPAVLIGEKAIGAANPAQAEAICTQTAGKALSIVDGDIRMLTSNCGAGRPTSWADYTTRGGYAGLKKALSTTPQATLAEVKSAGLVGRGGAAFPTGVKWEDAANAPDGPKYIVCNADESEPGTFKDRILMEEDPHRIIEGMIIAAYAVGASQGYLYVRGEYPRAFRIMSDALAEARQAGAIGVSIFHTGFNFDIEMRLGAGAYICGEETALLESIEGKRGLPRIKPPFPTTHGLFGKPTVINNVETFCNVPLIVASGAAEYRRIGTERSPGPKLFCVSGQVQRPGLYEVPFGVTLRHLLFDLAGGLDPGRKLQAVLMGGAAGAFAIEKDLDVILSFENLSAAGLPLGSGAVMVFDDSADLRDALKRLAHFFADESCGKCYPCQLGTRRQYEILERNAAALPLTGDRERLLDIGHTMIDASLCGLGQTAPTAILSAMNRRDFRASVFESPAPAKDPPPSRAFPKSYGGCVRPGGSMSKLSCPRSPGSSMPARAV